MPSLKQESMRPCDTANLLVAVGSDHVAVPIDVGHSRVNRSRKVDSRESSRGVEEAVSHPR